MTRQGEWLDSLPGFWRSAIIYATVLVLLPGLLVMVAGMLLEVGLALVLPHRDDPLVCGCLRCAQWRNRRDLYP